MSEKVFILPPKSTRYLSDITNTVIGSNNKAKEQADVAEKMYQLKGAIDMLK